MKIEFTSGNKQLQAHLDAMTRKVEPGATVAALNRTANHTVKLSRKDAAAAFGIPQKHLSRRIKVRRTDKARRGRHFVTIWAGIWEIPVANLTPKPRQLKGTGQAKYKTAPGQALDPHAFVARGKRGVTAFARKNSARLPIKQKTLNIGPVVRRRIWMNLGAPSRKFYEKTFYQQMDGRVINEFRKLGIKAQ